jgi:hypothetical protein
MLRLRQQFEREANASVHSRTTVAEILSELDYSCFDWIVPDPELAEDVDLRAIDSLRCDL